MMVKNLNKILIFNYEEYKLFQFLNKNNLRKIIRIFKALMKIGMKNYYKKNFIFLKDNKNNY
jgi:hypothetical protein